MKAELILSQSRSSFLLHLRLRIHFHLPPTPTTICLPRHVVFPSHCCLYATSFVRSSLSLSLSAMSPPPPPPPPPLRPRLFMCLPFYGNDTAPPPLMPLPPLAESSRQAKGQGRAGRGAKATRQPPRGSYGAGANERKERAKKGRIENKVKEGILPSVQCSMLACLLNSYSWTGAHV